jgi:hypothetical protein
MATITYLTEQPKTLTFHQALEQAELLARQKLPESLHERLSCAVALVKKGAVMQLNDGHTWEVESASVAGKIYSINGQGCDCPDAQYRAPQGNCKHRLSVFLARKALALMAAADTHDDAPAPEPEPEPEYHEAVPGIDPQFVVWISGRPFVRHAGLLKLAHARGLQSLTVQWTYNDQDLSLAHAVAVFQDGRRFEENGDASPQSVGKKVALHWRRCACTRASARALRLALGCDLVAVEELSDES